MIISVKEVKKYIYCVLVPLLVGVLSSMLSKVISGMDMSSYYNELIKPAFAPPGIIFPIVWTILYILMGTSSYIILSQKKHEYKIKDTMFYYWLQLALNFFWSILFFGFQLRLTALIDLVLLLITVLVMVYKFYKIKPIIYALILNYYAWFINK